MAWHKAPRAEPHCTLQTTSPGNSHMLYGAGHLLGTSKKVAEMASLKSPWSLNGIIISRALLKPLFGN